MKAVVFDLDGTLVDSVPDIHLAVNRMLADEGQEALDIATVTSFVGNGLPKLAERVMDHRGMDLADHARITADLLTIYQTTPAKLAQPYPGMEEALKSLQGAGYAMGVCSNKPHGPAVHLLCEMGLDGYFTTVIGGDSLPTRKPAPEMLQATLAGLGGGAALYVGDSEVDAETAVNAGVGFALFTRGYRKRPVAEIAHDYAFDEFCHLPDIVRAHFAG
ncbi:phosphoglycolate phosphatase [Shimia sediminis]|uniref:phosphoglycolate phosphatase n=1 Tax=Shimia sediminis TaxID=2497945 RepID=UPI000F8EB88C|nr:phosphoglycolate phosphatase [Shimia sediminis]